MSEVRSLSWGLTAVRFRDIPALASVRKRSQLVQCRNSILANALGRVREDGPSEFRPLRNYYATPRLAPILTAL
jgi:hypothetical protein